MGKTKTNPTKYAALVTYCLALVSLLVGLFLPTVFEGESITDSMLALQLPAAIDALFKTELGGAAFSLAFPVQFFGMGETIDLGAVFVLLYALFTAFGIIALIPVIASKKDRKTALKAASLIEILALIPLTSLVFIECTKLSSAAGSDAYVFSNFNILAAFGGTLLMLIVQSFVYKKGSGFIKFVLFMLSAAALLVAVYPIYLLVPALAEPMQSIIDKAPVGFVYLSSFFFLPLETTFGAEGMELVFVIALVIASLMAVINFMLDMFGLGKTTNKAMLVTNIVRYAIEVIAIILMIVMGFLIEGLGVAIITYVFAGIAVLQFIINIIRACTYKKAVAVGTVVVAKEKKEKPAKPVKEDKKVKKAANDSIAATVAEPVAEVKEEPRLVYSVGPIYDGPSDKFIETLTNDEKVEFARVFLERKMGNLPNIPKYVVGGENAKFFSSVFIYYGRIRGLVSDGLMNKFYQQGNMM